jgi:hypothetical protein
VLRQHRAEKSDGSRPRCAKWLAVILDLIPEDIIEAVAALD